MFKLPFHLRIRQQRLKRHLSQTQLSRECGISRDRWSQLERGYRRPSVREIQIISDVLHLRSFSVPPSGLHRDILQISTSLRKSAKPFLAHQDRPTNFRYLAALKRHRPLVTRLTSLARKRGDIRVCESHCQNIACGSYLEALYLLTIVVSGASPCYLTPASFGHTPHPIVDPILRQEVGHRPHACFATTEKAYFFQVSFATPSSICVDLLIWDGAWKVLEINGEGHQTHSDLLRSSILGLPVYFLDSRDVLAEATRLAESSLTSNSTLQGAQIPQIT